MMSDQPSLFSKWKSEFSKEKNRGYFCYILWQEENLQTTYTQLSLCRAKLPLNAELWRLAIFVHLSVCGFPQGALRRAESEILMYRWFFCIYLLNSTEDNEGYVKSGHAGIQGKGGMGGCVRLMNEGALAVTRQSSYATTFWSCLPHCPPSISSSHMLPLWLSLYTCCYLCLPVCLHLFVMFVPHYMSLSPSIQPPKQG